MSPEAELYQRACTTFDALVRRIDDSQWNADTPCAGWSVRDLVNHVTVEDLWAARLLAGDSLNDVGTAFDGDQLGDLPAAAWTDASSRALAVAAEPDAPTRTVHLSPGPVTGAVYLMELFADHLLHGWDLAVALDTDRTLDRDLVDAALAWFTDHRETTYRSAGLVRARTAAGHGADPQMVLLTRFGRTP